MDADDDVWRDFTAALDARHDRRCAGLAELHRRYRDAFTRYGQALADAIVAETAAIGLTAPFHINVDVDIHRMTDA